MWVCLQLPNALACQYFTCCLSAAMKSPLRLSRASLARAFPSCTARACFASIANRYQTSNGPAIHSDSCRSNMDSKVVLRCVREQNASSGISKIWQPGSMGCGKQPAWRRFSSSMISSCRSMAAAVVGLSPGSAIQLVRGSSARIASAALRRSKAAACLDASMLLLQAVLRADRLSSRTQASACSWRCCVSDIAVVSLCSCRTSAPAVIQA
mmetsp:Transcript_43325/g.81357  ORF Transcript_43325/g.81357 Transcript_43325/m.81357 type:complete len:211 (+) Transcript_43325:178-810(+)